MKISRNGSFLLPKLLLGGVVTFILLTTGGYAECQAKNTKGWVQSKSEIRLIVQNSQAKELMRQGTKLEKTGEIDQAIAVYEKLIRDFPNAMYEGEIGEGKYSEDARTRLKVLHCLKTKGPDSSTKTREELVDVLNGAIQGKNKEKLIQYASCDFKVGKPETDAVWQLSPNQVVPIIIGLSQSFDWSSISFDGSGNLKLGTKKGAGEHVFAFEQSPTGWKWTGYFTTDQEILDLLARLKKTDD